MREEVPGKEEDDIVQKKGEIPEKKFFASVRACVDASITVEAVFIIPMIMLLFLALLWFALHLHDRSVIEGALFQSMEEGGEYVLYGVVPGTDVTLPDGGSRGGLLYALTSASEEELRFWEERFYCELDGKLFLYRPTAVSFKKTAKGTSVYARFSCREFFPAGQWGLSGLFCVEYQCDRICPVREELTRAGSVLLDFYERAKK